MRRGPNFLLGVVVLVATWIGSVALAHWQGVRDGRADHVADASKMVEPVAPPSDSPFANSEHWTPGEPFTSASAVAAPTGRVR